MIDQNFLLENILVALTRNIGDGPCFLYIKFSWIGVFGYCHNKLCVINVTESKCTNKQTYYYISRYNLDNFYLSLLYVYSNFQFKTEAFFSYIFIKVIAKIAVCTGYLPNVHT